MQGCDVDISRPTEFTRNTLAKVYIQKGQYRPLEICDSKKESHSCLCQSFDDIALDNNKFVNLQQGWFNIIFFLLEMYS